MFAIDKTFVTSDHHFGRWKIPSFRFGGETFTQEAEEAYIANWNSVVKPTDLVIHVGDFCDGDEDELAAYRKRLNGDIILVKGNHDRLPDDVYRAHFQRVCEELPVEECNVRFRHAPDPFTPTKFRQIHGHVHMAGGELHPLDPAASFCVCVMRNNGFPVSFRAILERLDGKAG